MKNRLFQVIIIFAMLFIPTLTFADVESDLRKFGIELLKHRDNFVGFLDTNSLVDAKDFIKILKSDDDILNNFNQLFMKFNPDKTKIQFQKTFYCNTSGERYRLVFSNIGDNIGYESISFVHDRYNNSNKLKLFTVYETSYLNTMFSEDIDKIEDEVNELMDINFDFDKYVKVNNDIKFSEFKDSLSANFWKSKYFDEFKHKLKNEGGKILRLYCDDGYYNANDYIFYPVFVALAQIDDCNYYITFQRRNCLCEEVDPKYYLIQIRKEHNI